MTLSIYMFRLQNHQFNAAHSEDLPQIIQERFLSKKIGKEVGDIQFGLIPWSGTREGIFSFNILAQKHIEVDKDTYTRFID